MQPIEAIGTQAAGTSPLPLNLATEQPASVVARLLLSADVVAQAAQAIPPTPAALLTISPEAAGLINPVVTLEDNTQMLLLGEQTLEMIGERAGRPTQPAPQHAVTPPAIPATPGATLDTTA